MKKLTLLLVSVLILALSSCGSSKNASSETSFVMIAFGESGGVTGANNQYGLSKTGVLLETEAGEQEPKMLGRVSREDLEKINKLAAQTKKVESFRQEPGNLNRKILIQTGDTYYNYYWHMPEDTIATEVTRLYRELSKLVQRTDLNGS